MFSSSFNVRDVLQNRLKAQDRELVIRIRNTSTSTTFSTLFNRREFVTSYFDFKIPLDFDFHLGSETFTSKSRILSVKQLFESSESEGRKNVSFFVSSSLFSNIDRHRRRIEIFTFEDTEDIRRKQSITMINLIILEFWGTPKEDARRFLRIIDLNFMAQIQFIGKDLNAVKCFVLKDKCKGAAEA